MESETQLNAAPPARIGARNLAMIALAVGLLLACLGAEWWHRYTGTPEYSLSQLGKAVKDQNYGKASYYVDEERIASAISQSLTDVLLAKYTHAIQNDPLPFTETRIEILQKLAPHFHDLALLGVQNGIRLLLSGNPLLTGTSHFSQLDVHNFSGVHVVRSTVNGRIRRDPDRAEWRYSRALLAVPAVGSEPTPDEITEIEHPLLPTDRWAYRRRDGFSKAKRV